MRILLPFLLAALVGCQSINSVSLTQIPAKRNKKVQAEVSKVVVFYLSFDNDFVDSLVEKLKNQCEGGMIRGILTKDEVIDYFLGLVHKRQVTATGYCVAAGGPGNGKKVGLVEPQL